MATDRIADACGVVGAGLVIYGVALVSVPAAWMVAGAMLVSAGVALAWRKR